MFNCGSSVKKGMRFCTSCGKPMARPDISDGNSASIVEIYINGAGGELIQNGGDL